MASTETILSRRQALAGLSIMAAAIPTAVAQAAGGTAQPNRASWDKALAKFRLHHDEHEASCVAHAAVEKRFYAEFPTRPLAAECFRHTGYVASEKRQEQACDAAWEALGALIATPAPDLAEVVQKIELATEYGLTIHQLKPVCADLRRFLATRRV